MSGSDNLAIFLGLGTLNVREENTIANLLEQHNFSSIPNLILISILTTLQQRRFSLQ